MKKDKTKEAQKSKRIHDVSEGYADRKKKYGELKELRQMLRTRKAELVRKEKQKRHQKFENDKRKEENELKAGKFEIIKNPEKMRKWKLKARRLIRKIPKDIFYNKYFDKE